MLFDYRTKQMEAAQVRLALEWIALESLERMSRSDRPVLGNVNGRRLVASQFALRSAVVIVERVVFLIILAGSVSPCSLLCRLAIAIATHKFYPSRVFRRAMRGLIIR